MKKIDAEKALNAIAEGLKFINREKAKFGNYEEKWLKEVIKYSAEGKHKEGILTTFYIKILSCK